MSVISTNFVADESSLVSKEYLLGMDGKQIATSALSLLCAVGVCIDYSYSQSTLATLRASAVVKTTKRNLIAMYLK